MKISAINSFNKVNMQAKTADKKTIEKADRNISNPIINNSMAEALGRSQVVSFTGENRYKGPMFLHSCSEVLGDREDIQYNRQDGSFIHTIYDRKGILKEKQEFYPSLGKEVVMNIKDGIKTVKTATPNTYTIEKTDSKERQILLDSRYSDGTRTLTETEYDKQRQIITKESNGKKSVQVIDLRTKQPVTSGELVVKDYYDKENDLYYSKNLITGQILKETTYRPNGKIYSSIEYSEKTGRVTFELHYDSKTGGYNQTTYYDSGNRKTFTKIAKNERKEETFTFQEDGQTLVRHTKSEYDKNKNLIFETVYSPSTGVIETETEYHDDGCTVFKYNQATERPATAETYVNGTLTELVKYASDGETYAYQKEISSNGAYRETFFDELGYPKTVNKYSSDGFLNCVAEYDTITNIKIREKKYNKEYGDSQESFYDNEFGQLKKTIKRDSSGNLIRIINYYSDGRTQKNRQEFNPDGSYTYSVYDENGKIISENEYYADGTKKETYQGRYQNYRQYQSYQQYRTEPPFSPQREKPKSTQEVIDNILTIVTNKDRSLREIPDSEWLVLARILGTGDDISKLVKMDKATFRELSKKVHPDLNTDKTELQIKACETLFKIINNLYARNRNE